MRVVSQYVVDGNYGGPKARTDFEKVLHEEFNAKIFSFETYSTDSKLKRIVSKLGKFIRLLYLCLPTSEITIFQFPFFASTGVTRFIKNKVVFIHDINGVRHTNAKVEAKEINFIKSCRVIISHNRNMTEYLVEKGISSEKIVDIEVFDYLLERPLDYKNQELSESICYAGNLSRIKCPFVYEYDFRKSKYPVTLFGKIYDESVPGVINMGESTPNELPYKFSSKVGLVWDGSYPNLNHKFQLYNKLNNPHKLPCYLSAGIPVIVWENAAIREFVENNNVGYVISSLDDLENFDFIDYKTKRINAIEMGRKISTGYYSKNVMEKVISLIK